MECENCKFWTKHSEEISKVLKCPDHGDCKRYPPALDQFRGTVNPYFYPSVCKDNQCGEWTSKDTKERKWWQL